VGSRAQRARCSPTLHPRARRGRESENHGESYAVARSSRSVATETPVARSIARSACGSGGGSSRPACAPGYHLPLYSGMKPVRRGPGSSTSSRRACRQALAARRKGQPSPWPSAGYPPASVPPARHPPEVPPLLRSWLTWTHQLVDDLTLPKTHPYWNHGGRLDDAQRLLPSNAHAGEPPTRPRGIQRHAAPPETAARRRRWSRAGSAAASRATSAAASVCSAARAPVRSLWIAPACTPRCISTEGGPTILR
jgi:hypothetical protein